MMNKACVLVLDNIRSVENTASIFRTAECLGAGKIVLVGTTPAPVDRFGRKRKDFAKVSLGAEDMVEWEYQKEILSVLDELKSEGYKIISLEQAPRAASLQAVSSKLQTFALIVGNEVDGVSKIALENSDEIVEIPMKGKKESMNVSVATGVALFVLLQ